MRKRITPADQDSEVDMTPMLDIVFIMLIFFIVTTSFVKETGIEIQRPQHSPTKNKDVQNAIIIDISELDEITFADRAIQQDAVRANVEIALSENPNTQILVKVAEQTDAGIMVDVVDQVKQAGIKQVSVGRNSG